MKLWKMLEQHGDTKVKLTAGDYNGDCDGVADSSGDNVVSIGIPTNCSRIGQIAKFY